ncbi:TolC family protein [Sulfuriroseicoccus oceanibius]|uniref:TolC family protein n=1 Tax=Sulfuriroseicoccus oceanibius TaxID=2707525 RepID=A0A6B3L154_9BACT|nr:TolC family protein [Sulfuriroseicoccus oceanibius]QQL44104.1 TolC family protein [Sulfuriroseicoccus oceanibius]
MMTNTKHLLRPVVAGLMVASAALTQAEAGKLNNAYESFLAGNPDLVSQNYLVKAAGQEVVSEKRGYLPKMELELRQLAIGQDIDQDGEGVFQEGSTNYNNTRAKLEIDQPLLDFTLKHKVDQAKAKQRYQSALLESKEEELTEQFVESFLEAVRLANLEASHQRVVRYLEAELGRVSEGLKERVATVEDVENIKSALVAMKQEQRLLGQQRQRLLMSLGLDQKATAGLTLGGSRELTMPATAKGEVNADPQLQALQAEIDALESQIKSVSRKDVPRLSLYGLALHDDSDGSLFGTGRTLNGYEAGVMLKWDCFDRGINRSEAKRLSYMKKAKEAVLAALVERNSRQSSFSEQSLQLARVNLRSLDELVAHQATIHKATETAYREGGEKDYIQMVNAFLIYESQVRQQINGRFNFLKTQADLYAAKGGWSRELVAQIDRVFGK